jgi:group I intron endonuclease
MRVSGIYKIQSKAKPERFYIGSGVHIYDRWYRHKSSLKHNKHFNIKLQNHYNKYGKDDLIYSIVEPCLPEFLTAREQSYFRPLPWFNIAKDASSPMRGRKLSLEARRKISERAKGENSPTFGRKASKEERKRMSERMKGKKLSVETRLKMSGKTPWNKGKTGIYSDEYRQKISKSLSKRVPSFETREKLRKATTGRKLSEEAKKIIGNKVREAAIRRHLKQIA